VAISKWEVQTIQNGDKLSATLQMPLFGGRSALLNDVLRPSFVNFELGLSFSNSRPFNVSADSWADVPIFVDISTPSRISVPLKPAQVIGFCSFPFFLQLICFVQNKASVSWKLNVVNSTKSLIVNVSASGLVRGQLPPAPFNSTVFVPGYIYDDVIGVTQSMTISV
jgi:hypothetical protein